MVNSQQSFSRNIQALFDTGATGELTDRQLIDRFKGGEREAAELAFKVIVERHGPMVFHACRSILRDQHAAEDAFQATFLILARKAGSLWFRDSLGPWLYGVACRVAFCARGAIMRRRKHEQKAAEMATVTAVESGRDDRDAVVFDELNRLPERFRLAVMMCDLEGLTQEQAARQLGWPPGTVRSRLARGRGQLRDRLIRRGVAPSIVPVDAVLTLPTLPASLAATTVEIAVRLGAAGAATGTMASTLALTEGVMTIMFMSKVKLVLALVITGGVLIGGTELFGHRALGLLHSAPAAAKVQPDNHPAIQGEPIAPAEVGPQSLSPNARARLDVAKKLRDQTYKMFTAGVADLDSYLSAQLRFDDILADVAASSSNADKAHFNEVRVIGAKRLERFVKEAFANGERTESEALKAELVRLEAEDALAKAKVNLSVVAETAKARLNVAKKVRDAMYLKFKNREIDAERYLAWQKRHDELAYAVMLMTGGDKIRLYEGQVAELRRVEQVVKDLFQAGGAQEVDLHIVEYYRLESEEALARAKAETGQNPGTLINKE